MRRICVIGGANVDITATSAAAFQIGDSNPGSVVVSWGGLGRNIAHNLALLGDNVELITIFGGGVFGPVIANSCKELGIGISHSEIAKEGTNSFFISINNADGELVGGVADMNATEAMTPEWLQTRIDAINAADAVVADANSSAAALAWLIDNCQKPLYLDAVSVAKAARIKEAVAMSRKKAFFALKSNALEYQVLDGLKAAIDSLNKGGTIHYHETVPEKLIETRPISRIKQSAGDRDVELLKINKIKKYSPGVWHVVIDALID